MAVYDSVAEYRLALEQALANAMESRMLDYVKLEIQNAEEVKVYSYEPKFNSRRRIAGGIQDRDEEIMQDSYDSASHTLTVTVDAPWQQLREGAYPDDDLTDVIQNNRMYGAPPRPFAGDAEDRIQSKQGEAELIMALAFTDL